MVIASFLQTLRYSVRVLAKSPGFTSVAILSLALGIGANTAIFTLINALLLRDLPVREPERLVLLSAVRQGNQIPMSYPMFHEIERGQRVFSELMASDTGGATNVEINGVLSKARVLSVTGNVYSELGAVPLLGRLITPQDTNLSGGASSEVAVIGHEFWQRNFGGAPDVVGKQLRIESHPFTIVGVTRKWFTGLTQGEPPDITVPITAMQFTRDGGFDIESRSLLWLHPIGRLKSGVTIEQARAQLQAFWPDVLLATASTQTPGLRRQTFLSMGLDLSPMAKGLDTDLRSHFTRPLYVLAGIVGLILLVACVNLANLMLARAATRSHEMSVRVAIGASQVALVRQVLVESLSLSFCGAVLGLAFAYWGSRLLVLLLTEGSTLSVSLDLRPDLRVLSLTLCVGIFTGILFGLAPAWRCSRQDPAAALQQNARALSGGAGKLGKGLMVTQVAVSFILLLGAGLFIDSLERLRSVDFGFNQSSLLEVTLSPRPGGYEKLDLVAYHKQLLERVSSIPGVISVSYSRDPIPIPENSWLETVSPASADPVSGAKLTAGGRMVSPGFFRTLGIPLVAGREFDDASDQKHPRVAVVSNTLAQLLFPNGDAIGKSIRFGFMPDYQNIEIVGIARDARVTGLRNGAPPVVYLSSVQYPDEWGWLFIRTGVPPEVLGKVLGPEIESLGHEFAPEIRTIQGTASLMLTEERVTALLSGFFAALALLLASIGLYGLMSYAVTRRTREMGIRVALGAQRQNVLWIVLRETLTLALLGLAIGIPCALAACRLISSMLFGLTSSDVPTIAAVSLLLLIVALVAGYLPARRASSIDPMLALRSE